MRMYRKIETMKNSVCIITLNLMASNVESSGDDDAVAFQIQEE